MSKNFDETACLQSEKRQEWIREIRGERLQQIAEGKSTAPRLASSLAALFPRRNKCLGTHCSLIVQEERERHFLPDLPQSLRKSKDGREDRVARTERESDSRRREVKWQICWCHRDQQRACRMAQASAKKLEQTRPAENERVVSVPQRERAVGKYATAAFAKLKRNRAVSPEYQIMMGERVKVRQSHTLTREGDQRGSMKRKGRAGKESLLKRSRRKHERRRTARSKGRW